MIRIHRPKRPMKKSGFELPPGETTEIKGLTIVNRNKFSVWVDKFTAKKRGSK